jgi:ketosteroid isomerase-like protein
MAVAMSDLERRVECLEQAEEVRAFLRRYVTTMDNNPTLDALGELFTEDAVLTNPTRYVGRDAILAYYGGVLDAMESSRHHIVNSAIAIEDDGTARHLGSFVAFIRRDGRELVVQGDYDDVLVRGSDGRWRFREKGNQTADVRTLAAIAGTEE